MNPRLYPVARVVKVVDGDTVDLDVDLGFHVYSVLRFRLKGIDCPEMPTPEGVAAKEYTTAWLAAASDLIVQSWRSPGAYGRWEGVISRSDAHTLNTDLVATANAVIVR